MNVRQKLKFTIPNTSKVKFVRKSNNNLQLIISITEFQQIISQTRTVTRAKINSSIERSRITLDVSPRFVDSLPAMFRKNMGYRSIFQLATLETRFIREK